MRVEGDWLWRWGVVGVGDYDFYVAEAFGEGLAFWD